MRSFLAVSLLFVLTISSTVAAEEAAVSPNRRYAVRCVDPAPTDKNGSTKIVLDDRKTGKHIELFDYSSAGEHIGEASPLAWSPNSHCVALTLGLRATTDVLVFRISQGRTIEAELLPIPRKLDKPKYSFRGGLSVERWEDAQTLWLGDSSKDRSFRYRFTKSGKLLADAFRDDN